MKGRDLLCNGRDTGPLGLVISPIRAKASSWFGSSSEYNRNNEWIVNFGSGNCNNTNKNNSNLARAVAALDEQVLVEWVTAFDDCCLHKMSSVDCTLYRLDSTFDIVILAVEIEVLKIYYPGTSICFYVTYPRIREIFAAAFRDRIVQHWVCIRLNPLFEERHHSLGDVTYNCRVGFGTLAASKRVEREMLLLTNNYTRVAYCSTMDIWSFFMTIDKNVTWELLRRFILSNQERIKEQSPLTDIGVLLWLVEIIVMNCPQDDCQFKGDTSLKDKIAPWKSLLNAMKHIGLAIGNLTSQDFANFIMSFIDEWAVNFCRPRGMVYIRFVDDIFVGARRKEDIIEFRSGLGKILASVLHQRLHPDKFYIQLATHGVKFVGRVIKPGRAYTGNRTVGNFYNAMARLKEHAKVMDKNGVDLESAIILEHLCASANSLFGFLVHSCSYKIRMRGISLLGNAWKYCYIVNGHIVRIKKKYKISTIIEQQRNEEDSQYAAAKGGDRIQLFSAENVHLKHRCKRKRRRDFRVRKPRSAGRSL